MGSGSRKGKKKKLEKVRGDISKTSLGEVTMNDYANSMTHGKACSKRIGMQAVVKVHIKEKEDDIAWDEKDYDDCTPCGYSEERGGRRRGLRKVKGEQEDLGTTEGVDYPLDIWFLISEKIRPEDVGRFAAICQATYYVVSTARFWFTLYRRYYSWPKQLPDIITVPSMGSTRGLKADVIRSLFYIYSPFCDRISKEEPLSGHPGKLIGAQCVSHWHIRLGCIHKYYFMFAKQQLRKQSKHDMQKLTDSLVHVNPDEGFYILETISSELCHIPLVMGSHLHNGHLGLSAGFCSHRLQITLGPAYLLPKSNSRWQVPTTEMFLVTIEPVRDVRIYPWWHPQYPKCLPNQFPS